MNPPRPPVSRHASSWWDRQRRQDAEREPTRIDRRATWREEPSRFQVAAKVVLALHEWPKLALGIIGLGHLLWLYGYGLIHWRVGTVACALAWIMIVLYFWNREE